MKKNILNDIDKVKDERKLTKEMEKKIFTRAIFNWGIGVSLIILIMLLNFTKFFLPNEITINVYNICAIFFLVFSITSIEIGYKKDSGKWVATSIEITVFSIFVLFAPKIFMLNNYTIMRIFIALIAIYYSCKIIGIYCIDKKKYLTEISDIANIIKKESKDNLVEQEKEKRKEELRNALEKQINHEKNTMKITSSNKVIDNNDEKEKNKPQRKTRKKKTTEESKKALGQEPKVMLYAEETDEILKEKTTTRKPRSTNKNVNVPTEKIINKTAEEKPEEKLKRGRGRPRKNPLTEPEKTVEVPVVPIEEVKAQRTRTRKKAEETAEQVEINPEEKTKAQRTRTRKKAEETAEQVEINLEEKTKAKRTRTTKKAEETIEKVETKQEEKAVAKKTRGATKKKTETTPKETTTTRKSRTTTKKENNKQGE